MWGGGANADYILCPSSGKEMTPASDSLQVSVGGETSTFSIHPPDRRQVCSLLNRAHFHNTYLPFK